MTVSKPNQYWTLTIILLIAIIAIGGIVTWLRYSRSQPIEISTPPHQELQGEIYISGAVINPGFYSLRAGDTMEALIQATGGTTDSADLTRVELYIPQSGEALPPQEIDINRAELWLLEALPGIGETLAQRIIDYHNQNGAFRNINELLKVEGIGVATYDKIKHLITVAE